MAGGRRNSRESPACRLRPAGASTPGPGPWEKEPNRDFRPSPTEILDDVDTLLERDLGVQSSTPIDEDTRFFADLGLASIDAVVLSEAIQEHYGRPLPFNELMAEIGRQTERDLSIGELVAFLREHSSELVSIAPHAETLTMPKIHANGLNFHYQQAGEGPDVVLIHGVTGDLSIWFLCQAMGVLGRSFRVTAYDLRGHGYSDVAARATRRPTRPATRWRSWTPWRSTGPCWSATASAA